MSTRALSVTMEDVFAGSTHGEVASRGHTRPIQELELTVVETCGDLPWGLAERALAGHAEGNPTIEEGNRRSAKG